MYRRIRFEQFFLYLSARHVTRDAQHCNDIHYIHELECNTSVVHDHFPNAMIIVGLESKIINTILQILSNSFVLISIASFFPPPNPDQQGIEYLKTKKTMYEKRDDKILLPRECHYVCFRAAAACRRTEDAAGITLANTRGRGTRHVNIGPSTGRRACRW